MKNIKKLIEDILPQKNNIEKINIDSKKFFTYSYSCIDQENWNEKNDFIEIKDYFNKYSNIKQSNYNVRIENVRSYDISKNKFAKIGLTKTSSMLLTSGIETYNYTNLPYIYENELFYTYIIQLYKKIYLKKLLYEYKFKKDKIKTRKKFLNFTKNIWVQEITNDEQGTYLSKEWKKALELDTTYKEVKNKYDLIYKESNIEKTEKTNKFILIVLAISLIMNIINFYLLFK